MISLSINDISAQETLLIETNSSPGMSAPQGAAQKISTLRKTPSAASKVMASDISASQLHSFFAGRKKRPRVLPELGNIARGSWGDAEVHTSCIKININIYFEG